MNASEEALQLGQDAVKAIWPSTGRPTCRRVAAAVLEAAGPFLVTAEISRMAVDETIRAAERERIYAELGNDHYVIFTEDRWTIEHSVECRLSGQMHRCAWHEAVRLIADESGEDMAGRWRIDEIDSEGLPALVRATEQVPAVFRRQP